jgi:hypothetical protein
VRTSALLIQEGTNLSEVLSVAGDRVAANSIIRPRAWADDFYRSQNTTTP